MKRLPKDDEIVVLALNDVKHDLLSYPNKRKDIEILKPETRQIKKRDKGTARAGKLNNYFGLVVDRFLQAAFLVL